MSAIKPIDQSATKWQQRAAIAGPAYLAGVQAPRTPWAAASKAANASYVAGVTAAANAGRYTAGVTRAGDAKYTANAVAKGPARYAEGVNLAVGNWTSGFTPYQAVIAALQLPARGPVGSAANLQRVQVLTAALRARKLTGGP